MAHALAALMALCSPLVHPVTLRAVIQVESAANPYAVSINFPNARRSAGLTLPVFEQPRDRITALRLSTALHRLGYTTSLGLAQVNTLHATRHGLPPAALFNPCVNLQLAQRVLLDCQHQHTNSGGGTAPLSQILSCYNSGNANTGLANGYVAHIQKTALRQTNTPNLRSLAP